MTVEGWRMFFQGRYVYVYFRGTNIEWEKYTKISEIVGFSCLPILFLKKNFFFLNNEVILRLLAHRPLSQGENKRMTFPT